MMPHAGHAVLMGVVVPAGGLQASTPSSQLWRMFSLPVLPQFLNQAPPGAQQLTRPDFLNVPHFGHIITAEATSGVVSDVAIDVFDICHRASHR